MATAFVAPSSDARKRRRGPLRAVSGLDIVLASDAPLIAPGEYFAVGGKARQRFIFSTTKLAVAYAVLVRGPEQPEEQVILERWYHIDTEHGRITAGRHSDFRREWCIAAGRRPARGDRLAASVFARIMFRVEVRTVEKNARQQALAEANKYSIIAQVLERVAGGAQP